MTIFTKWGLIQRNNKFYFSRMWYVGSYVQSRSLMTEAPISQGNLLLVWWKFSRSHVKRVVLTTLGQMDKIKDKNKVLVSIIVKIYDMKRSSWGNRMYATLWSYWTTWKKWLGKTPFQFSLWKEAIMLVECRVAIDAITKNSGSNDN